MNITLVALINTIIKHNKKLREILSVHDILHWEESKELLQSYQELLNKLETANG
jgi:hypothetical protein